MPRRRSLTESEAGKEEAAKADLACDPPTPTERFRKLGRSLLAVSRDELREQERHFTATRRRARTKS